MGSEGHTLHILFFPFMAQGHMLPTVDIAKLFAAHGVKTTVLTTPGNVPIIQTSIDRAKAQSHHPIQIHTMPFPSVAGLPEGCENASFLPSNDISHLFFEAIGLLREPFSGVLRELRPDCVVTDMFLPWTYDVAAELGIPRIMFNGVSFFSLCVFDSLDRFNPLGNLEGEADSFVIPGLPHKVEMLMSQVPDYLRPESPEAGFFKMVRENDAKSYGVLVNSFYELEPDYTQHYRKVVGRKAWHVGPVALCNEGIAERNTRGSQPSNNGAECLTWLNGKSPSSVVYACFGSLFEFSCAQLREIMLGLEACNHPFIFVIRKGGNECIPEGFEDRVRERGLIIRGWAPQILILNHPAVGGFLTHCGWNSTLEGISAGVPLLAWPMFAEQFFNEKLVVDLLKIGVAVGVKKCTSKLEERELIDAERITGVINQLMDDGEEADNRRKRAKELGEMAQKAVEKDGSSYVDIGNLIHELMERQKIIDRKLIDVSNTSIGVQAA
uniref:Glycosyltransferase n=1 Tax=Aloe arborescens TaxID=45385 RepID=A0A2I4QA45_ALOAR|nr:glycosyltransferase 1 [Aloe arborescens]